MNDYSLFITAIPQPQARPRVFRSRSGGIVAHSPKSLFFRVVYMEAVKNPPKMRFEGPVSLWARFYLPRPKNATTGKGRARAWHIARPDLDNLEKAVMDALTQAGVWVDDSLVCLKTTSKALTQLGCDQKPGVFIRVTDAPADPYMLRQEAK